MNVQSPAISEGDEVHDGELSLMPFQTLVNHTLGVHDYFDVASGGKMLIYTPARLPEVPRPPQQRQSDARPSRGGFRLIGTWVEHRGISKRPGDRTPVTMSGFVVSRWQWRRGGLPVPDLDQRSPEELIELLADPMCSLDQKEPVAQALLARGASAVPALIAHLDDPRVFELARNIAPAGAPAAYVDVSIGERCRELRAHIVAG